jgi:hypothetical protein
LSVFTAAKFETPDMVCSGCGKRARGPVQPDWIDIDIRNQETNALEECGAVCGFKCLNKWLNKGVEKVVDATDRELGYVREAGEVGGQYLESINKFNLMELSEDEWLTFLQAVIGTYNDNSIPF